MLSICEELLGIKDLAVDHKYDYVKKFIQFVEQEAGSAVLMSTLQVHFGSYSEFGVEWYGVIFGSWILCDIPACGCNMKADIQGNPTLAAQLRYGN